jgi:uncharacterized protein (TIGR03083 family)
VTLAVTEPTLDDVFAALLRSHDQLVETLTSLSDGQLSGPSYDTEWSIADVCSHLGSGAEIFGLFVEAGLQGTPAPGIDVIRPVWDVWNAKTDDAKLRDAITSDAAFLNRIEMMTSEARSGWQLDVFGTEQNLAAFLRMRLAEHALHTWDVIVALDPTATVADDATLLIIDNLPALVERAGKGGAQPVTVYVTTSVPDRAFVLELTAESATLVPASGALTAATLALTGEAFIRLVYGRLDTAHTPDGVKADGVHLDTLRAAFPGV